MEPANESGGGGGEIPCCISHLFFRSASENPDKVAVVHASGGLRLCRELRERLRRGDPGGPDEERRLLDGSRESSSSSPPVYRGDECFTYANILSAVGSLSRRIRRVLDGGDDPDLVRPKGSVQLEQTVRIQNLEFLSGSNRIPEIVGVHIGPSIEYIVAILSILRCGEAFLPLDPLWPEERVLSIAASSRTGLIITCVPCASKDESCERNNAGWIADGTNCSVLCFSMRRSLKDNVGQSDSVWPCETKNQRLFCYLMYTSGSTGKPKGVCGTEKGLVNRFSWMQQLFPVCGEDILLFKTSISFVDHLQELFGAILTCTPLIVPPFDELKTDPFYLIDILKVYHVSRLISVPSFMRAALPAMQNLHWMNVQESLKFLILSGEILLITLWSILHKLLPETVILNLYGSTEVSGDCTYFDCKNLPKILETETLSSVPIGMPISNCEIVLLGKPHMPDEGEICVMGDCLSVGYLDDLFHGLPIKLDGTALHFKTGDFARRLQSGNFVFLGRKDRTVKVNGQRVALEEIEDALRENPDVCDAAVTLKYDEELSYLKAYIMLKERDNFQKKEFSLVDGKGKHEGLILSIRHWLARKLPPAMIPNQYICVDSFPVSSTGKVDYTMLESSASTSKRPRTEIDVNQCFHDHLQIIKEAFCNALLIEKCKDYDDFFIMGGNSVTAAQVAHILGVDMRLLYMFPSPVSILTALLDRKSSEGNIFGHNIFKGKRLRIKDVSMEVNNQSRFLPQKNDEFSFGFEPLKSDSILYPAPRSSSSADSDMWISQSCLPSLCSFSRCNQLMHGGKPESKENQQEWRSIESPRNKNWCLQELWKVSLKSCVDASPLVVLKDGDLHLFIGSHSHIFLCVDASSGSVRWEIELEGRIESSAATTSDFSQVVVGCYNGKIYFLDFITGSISWAFQTDGEVKMQPVACRNLIWCGSHDHWLYALDYLEQCCVYKISCGGSIYGSPSIDMVHNMIYVASTGGRVTAISVEVLPFTVAWLYESGVPIFGSLSLNSLDGNVVCCLVDGHVVVLNSKGSVVWKAITGGPIFAGACMSSALPSQVLICSRNGSIYSFDSGGGHLLWEYQTGDPITSSAYVDEQIKLIYEPSHTFDRLVSICSSSGSIHVLGVNSIVVRQRIPQGGKVSENPAVRKIARMDLPGDIFSSPVMIGGRIFVGCRDDFVHCVSVVT